VAPVAGFGHAVQALYNLKSDLRELTNLKDDPAQASRVRNMLKRFQQRYASPRTTP
jgi:hypothetical protein